MERQLFSPSFPSLGLPPFTEMGLPLPHWVRSRVVADSHCDYSKQAKDHLCSSGSVYLPGLAEGSPQGRLARMKMLGFESGPEGQLGAHARDPGQTVVEGCGGADVGPTEPGEGSGALLRLLAAPRCYPCHRMLPPGQGCGHILRQRPRHSKSGCLAVCGSLSRTGREPGRHSASGAESKPQGLPLATCSMGGRLQGGGLWA